MPAARNMDISATGDVTCAAYAENATRHDAFLCTSSCSVLCCGFTSGSECPIHSNSRCLLPGGLQSNYVSSSAQHPASTVTAPDCWSSVNSGHVTSCTSSVPCSDSTWSLTDNVSYSYPMSSVAAEDKDCSSHVNGISSFIWSHF